MFRQIINQNPFLSQEANYCFGNITADSFDGDYSLVSTLRALVAPRMEDGDEIQAYFEYHSYSKSFVGSRSVDSIVKELRSPGDEEYLCSKGGFIYIHNLNGTQVDNYAVLEAVKSGFTDVYNGWVQLERVTAFYRKEFYVLCFVNTEAKCVEIFVDNLDVRKLHYLQCSIVAFLPYIGAVSQCVASCKSLNFGDPTVMAEFMEGLYGERTSLNNKCIELPNGSTVTPKEAIVWLKKQEEESDE